jgi:hypothetical protein
MEVKEGRMDGWKSRKEGKKEGRKEGSNLCFVDSALVSPSSRML